MQRIGIVGLLCLLGGCSAVETRSGAATTEAESRLPRLSDGVTYWMPRRDVVVSIAFGEPEEEATDAAGGDGDAPPKKKGQAKADGADEDRAIALKKDEQAPKPKKKQPVPKPEETKSPVIKIAASEAYADTGNPYVASFSRNLVGKNQLTIEVNNRGLLNSAKSETTAELPQIFSALASAAGSIYAANYDVTKTDTCPEKVNLLLRIKPEDNPGVFDLPDAKGCVSVKITAPTLTVSSNERAADKTHAHSGFFYRQNLPYEIEVKFGKWTTTDVVFLPNKSPVQFIPVEKSLFASNASDLTFQDGVLTKYGQGVEGEVLALAKLPADVLKAYFGAVGEMFTFRKDAASKEAEYLYALTALTKSQLAAARCMAAYESRDEARIAADCQ